MPHQFLHEVGSPIQMKGKGAPRDIVFGVIGKTAMDPSSKSLGGLVEKTTGGKQGKGTTVSSAGAKESHGNTVNHILGVKSKTPLAGSHYGQVRYAGQFYGQVGQSL